MQTTLSLDYETASDAQLVGPKSVGLVNYMRHESTRPLMLAWSWNKGRVEQADLTNGDRLPPEVIDGLTDPHVHKWAFNAAFERLATDILLGLDTPIKGWRCTMALAYMRSFKGGLDDVGVQIGLPASQVKDPRGKKLIQLFSVPQRITRNQPLRWRDSMTDPDAWEEYLTYNRQDVLTENRVHDKLIGFPILSDEWKLYEIDQAINDEGLPVDIRFVRQAKEMAARRKDELMDVMRELTSLGNPNSGKQLLPWLRDRGYPFADLQKNTLKKVITENEYGEEPGFLDGSALAVLKLRQQASRTSVKKYDAIERRVDADDRIRHCFQFAGASRTNRWSGRGPQPHNLVRTPKLLEGDDGNFEKLESATDAIRFGQYDLLELLVDEPMVALAGCLRSSFRAPDGYEFVVCDLSAIESAVIAWLSGCKRMLGVFHEGLDPYADFGVELYGKPYDEVKKNKSLRNGAKPATLGCGFGLGGGKLHNGKRTGLWGYAEGMGVDITKEEAARQVKLFRKVYSEIPEFWQNLERAARLAVKGKTTTVGGLLTFRRQGSYVTMQLPSGRLMFYHLPKMMKKEFPAKDGTTYERIVFTHMGKSQITTKWGRMVSGGPKLCENAVQATARDVLKVGVLRAEEYGFNVVGTVHDEIIALQRKGDNYFTLDALHGMMVEPLAWMKGLPLAAAGYVGELYRKD